MVAGGGISTRFPASNDKRVSLASSRFHADHADLRAKTLGRDGAAGNQSSAADADYNGVKIRNLFKQFQRSRALAGNGPGMIVGWNQGRAGLLRQLLADQYAVFAKAVIGDDFAPRARVASTFERGASSGMASVAGIPSDCAAIATACA